MENSFSFIREAFLSRLLPMFHEVQLAALRSLKPEDYPHAAAFAAVGALLAAVLLYAIGVWLRRLPARVSTEAQRAKIESVRSVAHSWLPWLLFLAPTPIGGMLTIAAGFFAIRRAIAAVAILAAEIAWRVSPLL